MAVTRGRTLTEQVDECRWRARRDGAAIVFLDVGPCAPMRVAEVPTAIVSELCHIPPETPGTHRDLRGHVAAHRCCGKSLIGSALVGCASARASGFNFQACPVSVRTSVSVNASGPQRLGGRYGQPNSKARLGIERNGSGDREDGRVEMAPTWPTRGAIFNELEAEHRATNYSIARGAPTSPVKPLKTQKLELAERVGFAPLLVVANKELN